MTDELTREEVISAVSVVMSDADAPLHNGRFCDIHQAAPRGARQRVHNPCPNQCRATTAVTGLCDAPPQATPTWFRPQPIGGSALGYARLLAAMDHTTRAVLVQHQVNGAPGEVRGFVPLLEGLDLASLVVTADALQANPEAAEFLVTSKQAHHLFVVKANQPALLERCSVLPWHRVPVGDRTRDLRTSTRRWRTVVIYAITSLPFESASPARSPTSCADTGQSRRGITSAIPLSLRTPGRSAPGAARV